MKPISRKPFGVLMLILLPACATVSTPDYPRQHPANPDALQVAAPAASSALETYRPMPVRKNPPVQSDAPSAEVSGHTGHGNPAQDPTDEPGENHHDQH